MRVWPNSHMKIFGHFSTWWKSRSTEWVVRVLVRTATLTKFTYEKIDPILFSTNRELFLRKPRIRRQKCFSTNGSRVMPESTPNTTEKGKTRKKKFCEKKFFFVKKRFFLDRTSQKVGYRKKSGKKKSFLAKNFFSHRGPQKWAIRWEKGSKRKSRPKRFWRRAITPTSPTRSKSGKWSCHETSAKCDFWQIYIWKNRPKTFFDQSTAFSEKNTNPQTEMFFDQWIASYAGNNPTHEEERQNTEKNFF